MGSEHSAADEFSPPLDPGIEIAVLALRAAGIETFESCQGGPGHTFPEPTVRFHGNNAEGFRALAAAMTAGLKVTSLRRAWSIVDGEPTGPHWEMVFVPPILFVESKLNIHKGMKCADRMLADQYSFALHRYRGVSNVQPEPPTD